MAFAFDAVWANTIAGAITPVLIAGVGILARLALRRIERDHETLAVRNARLERKLSEAEVAIRGDIANGTSDSCDRLAEIDRKISPGEGAS